MSFRALDYVSELRVAPNGAKIAPLEKLLLLVLAHRHNPDHQKAWPSLVRMAEETGLSERQVRYLLRDLEGKQVVMQTDATFGDRRLRSYIFLELDPDPRLQHTLDHSDCPACEDSKRKGARCAPFRTVENSRKGGTETPKRGHDGGTAANAYKEECRTKNLIEPSASGEADPRHQAIKEIIVEFHAATNDMPKNLVTWDGREGGVLKKLLLEKKAMTVEQARRCIANYYASDENISQRPAAWIANMFDRWLSPTNEFGKPRIFERDRMRAKL